MKKIIIFTIALLLVILIIWQGIIPIFVVSNTIRDAHDDIKTTYSQIQEQVNQQINESGEFMYVYFNTTDKEFIESYQAKVRPHLENLKNMQSLGPLTKLKLYRNGTVYNEINAVVLIYSELGMDLYRHRSLSESQLILEETNLCSQNCDNVMADKIISQLKQFRTVNREYQFKEHDFDGEYEPPNMPLTKYILTKEKHEDALESLGSKLANLREKYEQYGPKTPTQRIIIEHTNQTKDFWAKFRADCQQNRELDECIIDKNVQLAIKEQFPLLCISVDCVNRYQNETNTTTST